MASKLFQRVIKPQSRTMLKWLRKPPLQLNRNSSHYIPPSQYDSTPYQARKFSMSYILFTQWEIIPVVVLCVMDAFWLAFSILWAFRTKVDVVYKVKSRDNISRTMDLCHPEIMKLWVINNHKDFRPWPAMKCVQLAMQEEESKIAMFRPGTFVPRNKRKYPVICNPATVCEQLDRLKRDDLGYDQAKGC